MLLGIGQPDLYGAGSRGVLVHFCVPPMGLKGQLGSHHLASAKGKASEEILGQQFLRILFLLCFQTGDVCISILHPPVDDPQSGELPSERWNPTQNVR